MKPVRFTEAAEADLQNAFVWYEGKRRGLGEEFLERVDQAINQIGKNPLAARKVVKDVRKLSIRQFPYGLWYRVAADSVVIACLHHRRSPVLARKRALRLEP